MARVLFNNTQKADVNNRSNVEAAAFSGFPFLPSRLFWSLSFLYASFIALHVKNAVLLLLSEMRTVHGLFVNDAIVFHQRFFVHDYRRTTSQFIKSLKVLGQQLTKWIQIETHL